MMLFTLRCVSHVETKKNLNLLKKLRSNSEGFKQAIANGVPKEMTGILVDEEFGSYFKKHISDINPDFVKVLVRYNPNGNAKANLRQMENLRILSDIWKAEGLTTKENYREVVEQAQSNNRSVDSTKK